MVNINFTKGKYDDGDDDNDYCPLIFIIFYFYDQREGKKCSYIYIVLLSEQVKNVSSVENIFEMGMYVSKS